MRRCIGAQSGHTMDGFSRNRLAAPLVRFEGSTARPSRPTKIVAFAVVAVIDGIRDLA
jgi:hypothetical protein